MKRLRHCARTIAQVRRPLNGDVSPVGIEPEKERGQIVRHLARFVMGLADDMSAFLTDTVDRSFRQGVTFQVGVCIGIATPGLEPLNGEPVRKPAIQQVGKPALQGDTDLIAPQVGLLA